jgi:recombination protein RecA
MNQEFLEAIGVDVNKMLYVPLETVEDIFEAIDSIIESVRSSDKKKLVTIVVDSVAGASTKVEISADYDQAGYATQKAIIISKAMRKVTNLIGRERISLIFTNQLRTRLGVSFGDPWTTSGGKAIAFHSSCRLRLKQMGQLKSKVGGVDQVVGIKTRAQVIKNRMGPPLRSVDYDIYFDSGIDNYGSWLQMMKSYKLVNQSGAWYTYVDKETGEEIKFQAKNFEDILAERPEVKESIYNQICDAYIMSYKQSSAESNIDNIEVADFDE